jgi:hypothetical protein
VLDSGCTNHMTGERRMLISFKKNECESDSSRSVTIAKVKSLVSVKLLSQPNIQFLKFLLSNLWTIICYPFHNFVRCVTIICSPIKV